MNNKIFSLVVLFLSANNLFAQKGVTTLGIQLKPMVPSQFFGTGPVRQLTDHTDALLENRLGWNSGVLS